MRFISGLKKLFSKWIYALIIIYFLISWLLILLGIVFFPDQVFFQVIRIILSILFGFSLLLFIFSFFKPLDELHYGLIIVAFLGGLFFLIIFDNIISLFYIFCFYANLILTAFFAFKLCMDSAINVDNFLSKKEKYRKMLRGFEFILFTFLNLVSFLFTLNFFRRALRIPPLVELVFRVIFWLNIIFLTGIVIRLIITKKFAAYFALFLLLVFLYMLYRVVDFYAEIIFANSSGYNLFTYILDLILFIYIIGSIFDRVDFLKEKLKYLRVDTIALFVIIMKLVVQGFEIISSISGARTPAQIQDELGIMILFIIFTISFGIYKLIKHSAEREKTEINLKKGNNSNSAIA
jgi:hypothetical protein